MRAACRSGGIITYIHGIISEEEFHDDLTRQATLCTLQSILYPQLSSTARREQHESDQALLDCSILCKLIEKATRKY